MSLLERLVSVARNTELCNSYHDQAEILADKGQKRFALEFLELGEKLQSTTRGASAKILTFKYRVRKKIFKMARRTLGVI